jgi:hypothetical protein
MPNPANRDPAEGSRDVVDHELARAGGRMASIKNPQNEAQKPGGIPTETVKGSSPGQPHDPEGQQGSTNRKNH